MDVGDPDVDQRLLGGPVAEAFHLVLGGVEDLFDPVRVDPAVQDQLLQGEPADLAPDRVEAGQQHGLGGVVDDQVDAGGRLERPDVAALAADDPALHLVARQVQDADHALRGLLAGDPLNGVDHDVPGAGVGGALGVAFDVAYQDRGLPLRLVLDALDQLGPGHVGGQAGDPFEFLAVLLLGRGQLRLATGQRGLPARQVGVHRGEPALALHQPLDLFGVQPFPLVDARGAALHLGGLFLRRGVQQGDLAFAAAPGGGPDLFGVRLGLTVGVLEDRVGLGVGGLEHPAGLGTGGVRLRLRGGGLRAYRCGLGFCVVDLVLAVLGLVLGALQLAQCAGTEDQAGHDKGGENDDRHYQHPIQGGHLAESPFAAPQSLRAAVPAPYRLTASDAGVASGLSRTDSALRRPHGNDRLGEGRQGLSLRRPRGCGSAFQGMPDQGGGTTAAAIGQRRPPRRRPTAG